MNTAGDNENTSTNSLTENAFDALPTQAAILDENGVIVKTNDEWDSFGKPNPEKDFYVGKNYIELCKHATEKDGPEVATKLTELLNNETTQVEHEYPCNNPNTPQTEWFQLRATSFTHDNQQNYLVLHWEITEQKHNRDKLQQFSSTLSHDINNHLSIARGYIDLLDIDGEDNQQHKQTILNALDDIETTIESTTTLARIEQVENSELCDLETIADEAWEANPTQDATLNIKDNIQLKANRTLLLKAFDNIIRNMLTHAGHDATLTIESTEDGFRVYDDGPGSTDDPEDLLSYGYTTGDGTGLGLAIIKQIADAHNWYLTINQEHDGFCLEFELP